MDYAIVISSPQGETWIDDVLYGGDSLSPDFVSEFAQERAHHGKVTVVEISTGRAVFVINADEGSMI